jgi:hypothetical protein
LLPIRLETRFRGNNLLVRIFPDDVFIDTHEPDLTEAEYEAAKQYISDRDLDERAAWRSLVQWFGATRAAWIAHWVQDRISEHGIDTPPPLKPAAWTQPPKMRCMPDFFTVFAYRDDELVYSKTCNPLQPGLTVLASPENWSSGGLFDTHSEWVRDFEAAEAVGMATTIRLTSQDLNEGFSRLCVVGIRSGTAAQGKRELEDLLRSHHYTEGLAFVGAGSSTNNSASTQSPYSERDDSERSFSTEIRGPLDWDAKIHTRRSNAHRLADALGIDAEIFRYTELSGDIGDFFADDMNRVIWAATGDPFFRNLLPNVLDPAQLASVADHVQRYVRGGGPLPTIRLGRQPYGVLPVTRVASADQSDGGWQSSTFDGHIDVESTIVDEAEIPPFVIRGIILRGAPTGNYTFRQEGPTAGKVRLLRDGVEVLELDYKWQTTISFDNPYRFSFPGYFDIDIGKQGRGTQNLHGLNESVFDGNQVLRVQANEELDRGIHQLATKFFGRWLELARNPSLVPRVNTTDDPDQELLSILSMEPRSVTYRARPFVTGVFVAWLLTVLRHYAFGDGTPYADSGVSPLQWMSRWSESWKAYRDEVVNLLSDLAGGSMPALTNPPLLHLVGWWEGDDEPLNMVYDPEQPELEPSVYLRDIVRNTDADIPTLLAHIARRALDLATDGEERTQIAQALNRLSTDVTGPDLDRMFRDSLDLSSHRVDAWITSFASKRLYGMRRRQAEGIHLGAYGFVEDLGPRGGGASSGYVHAPSAAQACTSAVLHNAFLTHQAETSETAVNPFRANLTSSRVRYGLRIVEGIRQGQSLDALLGYQFERALQDHARPLEQYIDDFREAFPVTANKIEASASNESVETIAARNVVAGADLLRDYRKELNTGGQVATILESTQNQDDREALEEVLQHIDDTLDSVSDLLLTEGVHQAIQGNYERSGAAIDAASGNTMPPERFDSVTTPVSGRQLTHRVCLLFNGEKQVDESDPRGVAEPRIAYWFESLLGPTSEIGCEFEIQESDGPDNVLKRVNINTATAAQLARVPGVDQAAAEHIVEARRQKLFDNVDDLKRIGVTGHLKPFLTTGPIERVNINQDPSEVLAALPRSQTAVSEDDPWEWLEGYEPLGTELAQRIVGARNFDWISDLERVDGVTPSIVQALRPFITTGRTTLSLDDLVTHPQSPDGLGMSASDLLYIAQTPPEGTESELDLRIGYLIRSEFALSAATRVQVSAGRLEGFEHSLEDAVELARQALKLLAAGRSLSPDLLSHPGDVIEAGFSVEDMQILRERVEVAKDLLDAALSELLMLKESNQTTTVQIVSALLRSARFGVYGAAPPGADDLDLAQRLAGTIKELDQRSVRCAQLINTLPDSPTAAMRQLVKAMRAIFGGSFVVAPLFAPHDGANLERAFNQSNLIPVDYESRLRLWLQQMSEVRPVITDLEDLLMLTEAWTQAALDGAPPSLRMRVAQLPFSAERIWLGLSIAEEAEAKPPADQVRSPLSVVAALAGDLPDLTTDSADASARVLAGLMLDEVSELIPNPSVDTSVAFHYDSPSSQAPQTFLLAVPSSYSANAEPWTQEMLVQIVNDTVDLAKVRTVDIDALRSSEDAVAGGAADVGAFLPAIYMAADPQQTGWAGESLVDTVDKLISDLTYAPAPCADLAEVIKGNSLGPRFDDLGIQLVSIAGGPPLAQGAVFPETGIRFTWPAGARGELRIVISPKSNNSPQPIPAVHAFNAAGDIVKSGWSGAYGFFAKFIVDLDIATRVEITGGYRAGFGPIYFIRSICVQESHDIAEGKALAGYEIVRIVLRGAPMGDYTFHWKNPVVHKVSLLRNGVEVYQLDFDWQASISFDNPYRFSFPGYFDIEIGTRESGTRSLYGLIYSFFDGMQVLRIQP